MKIRLLKNQTHLITREVSTTITKKIFSFFTTKEGYEDYALIDFVFPDHLNWGTHNIEIKLPATKQEIHSDIKDKATAIAEKHTNDNVLKSQLETNGVYEDIEV